MSCKFKQIVN